MTSSVPDYHLQRAEMERDAALRAACGESRISHLKMAALHEARARRLQPADGGDSER